MIARWKRMASALVPAPLRTLVRAAVGWRWFEGSYTNWADAQAASGCYDGDAIVTRVAAATQLVRAGVAAYERDGVCFTPHVPEAGLLAALRTVAAASGSRLRVLDFGGALGTTYWRHRNELKDLCELGWDIVEQARWVARGPALAGGTPLRFFPSVAAATGPYDVLLASTTIQYLPAPAAAIEEWMDAGFPWLLFNNLPLHAGAPDRIAVQRVPPSIYLANYPVWFFNRERFLARFDGRYDLVTEFVAEAVWPVGWRSYPSTGLLLRRKEAP